MAKGAKRTLLPGGNPQIPKGYGDAPVQAWIAAAPGWKGEVGRRVDSIVESTVPGVRKAVKWNSPMYGIEDGAWFLSLHCFNDYVKVAFFRGASLDPLPPVGSKQKDVRYFHIHQDEAIDQTQLGDWSGRPAHCPANECRKATAMTHGKKGAAPAQAEASAPIDARIAALDDWRGRTLARLRARSSRPIPR